MAADLYVHIITENVKEEHFREFFCHTMGSPYFDLSAPNSDPFGDSWRVIGDSPSIHIGEVSWLKAALTGDTDEFVPNPVGKVSDLVGYGKYEDAPVIDDEFIQKVREAMALENSTGYQLNSVEDIVAFFEHWKGYRVFSVSW